MNLYKFLNRIICSVAETAAAKVLCIKVPALFRHKQQANRNPKSSQAAASYRHIFQKYYFKLKIIIFTACLMVLLCLFAKNEQKFTHCLYALLLRRLIGLAAFLYFFGLNQHIVPCQEFRASLDEGVSCFYCHVFLLAASLAIVAAEFF